MTLKRWMVFGIAAASFAAGSLLTAQVRAERGHVYDLRIYHAVPGKLPKLEARFRDATKLFAEHHLHVLGYWEAKGDRPGWQDTFVYLLAHDSEDEAKKNWDAFHHDPAFQVYVQSEHEEKLIENDDRTYMRPLDFSELQ